MSIENLIKKIDQDRKKLPEYPNVESVFPLGSMNQITFLSQIDNTLASSEDNSSVEIKEMIKQIYQNANQLTNLKNQQLQSIKELNQKDAPKKILADLELVKKQIKDSNLNFISKKKINKKISDIEIKYNKYAELVNVSEQLSKQMSQFDNKKNIEELKDKLKYFAYYEALNEDLDNMSIMPELLKKRSYYE